MNDPGAGLFGLYGGLGSPLPVFASGRQITGKGGLQMLPGTKLMRPGKRLVIKGIPNINEGVPPMLSRKWPVHPGIAWGDGTGCPIKSWPFHVK